MVDTAPLERMNADLLQLDVPPGSRLAGVYLDELRLPVGAVVTLVLRDGRGFVPDRDTRLRTGDSLLIVATAEVRDLAERRLRAVSRRGRLARWFAEEGRENRPADRNCRTDFVSENVWHVCRASLQSVSLPPSGVRGAPPRARFASGGCHGRAGSCRAEGRLEGARRRRGRPARGTARSTGHRRLRRREGAPRRRPRPPVATATQAVRRPGGRHDEPARRRPPPQDGRRHEDRCRRRPAPPKTTARAEPPREHGEGSRRRLSSATKAHRDEARCTDREQGHRPGTADRRRARGRGSDDGQVRDQDDATKATATAAEAKATKVGAQDRPQRRGDREDQGRARRAARRAAATSTRRPSRRSPSCSATGSPTRPATTRPTPVPRRSSGSRRSPWRTTILERVTQVERALERLDEGSYGWCERCGNPIPVERLAAFPSATLCVTCKQLEERR